MKLLSPAYQIVIGGKKVDTTEEPLASTVKELLVDLDMDAPSDSVLLRLGNVGGLQPAVGDDAAIKLGFIDDDSLTLVFTGKVVAVDPSLPETRVIAHSPAQGLLRTYVEKTFENKSGGDIVRELADGAGITVAQVDRGAVFPAYVVDGKRSVHRHLYDLATYCGCDLLFNADGELLFRQYRGGGVVHIFQYAKQIIELEVRKDVRAQSSVNVFGESPGTSQGSNSWAWLTKDFSRSKGSAGTGDPVLLLERPVLRTRELAQAAADGFFRESGVNAVRGRMLTFGVPQVALGDSIRVKDAPDARVNGDFQARAVRHRITKNGGFTTEIEFRGAAA